ncbi:MAG: class I SAM-dependent methyltransferase [Planctomycetes bacterium]|nr:class I SAM-dependent methyltransferase [Planctomycetota bacterium]
MPTVRQRQRDSNPIAADLNSHSPASSRRSWYDYPEYYDLAFADETQAEADFIQAAIDRYARRPVRTMLEPGCGSGRLVTELASRGYQVSAFDNNRRALDFLRRRLARRKLSAHVFEADLVHFQLPRRVDLVYNTFNTFRHLLTEQAAVAHLRKVAAHLKPGGLFILGLHLLPPDALEECTERWRARRGATTAVFTLRVIASSRRLRRERLRVNMLVRHGQRTIRAVTEFDLRLYTAAQLRKTVSAVPELELCDVFDFNYVIDEPMRLDNELSDTVLVLRKR